MSNQIAKTLIPKLRFPEFRDADGWEEKPLNQISNSIFDGTHQTPTYIEEGIPFFSVENIISGKLNKFISREDYLTATFKNKPEKGDVLITRIGNIGFSVVVDWDYEFSIYVTLAVVKQNAQFDSYFLHSFMQSERYQTAIQSKSLLNAVPCKINMDELRNTLVSLPSPKEQQKVADCLRPLDELITAQAQKLYTLKLHKKGLMQQLFPAAGETVPKLRFPEFRDAPEWEEKLLGEIGEVLQGYGFPERHQGETEGEYPFYKVSDISNSLQRGEHFINAGVNYISSAVLKELKAKPVPVGSTIFARIGEAIRSNRRVITTVPCIIDNNVGGLKSIKGKSHDIFVYYLMANINLGDHSGGVVPAVNKSTIESIPITCPGIPEQKSIADFLSSIDELIAAQSQRLYSLKAHKKGLMQQLFPSADEVQG